MVLSALSGAALEGALQEVAGGAEEAAEAGAESWVVFGVGQMVFPHSSMALKKSPARR